MVKSGAGKKRKQKTLSSKIAVFFGMIMAVVFMPTTILLFFGMIPTLVAGIVDRSKRGTRVITVGAMNLAGCTPFLLDLWTSGHSMEIALTLLSSPVTVIVMWMAAVVGYMIDWSVSGIVSTVLVQRAEARLQSIRKRHEALAERWGPEVSGDLALDAYGFPLEPPEATALPKENAADKKDKENL